MAQYRLPESIEAHYEWDEPALEPCQVEPVLDHLLEQACAQLQGRVAGSVTVVAQTPTGWKRGRRLLRDATSSLHLLRLAAQRALEGAWRPGQAARVVEVRLSELAQPQAIQGRLFGPTRPNVQTAIQAMQQRFPGALMRAVLVDQNAYLPEEAFRFEPVSDKVSAVSHKSTKANSMKAKPTQARAVTSPPPRKEGRPEFSSSKTKNIKTTSTQTNNFATQRHNRQSSDSLLPGFEPMALQKSALQKPESLKSASRKPTLLEAAGR